MAYRPNTAVEAFIASSTGYQTSVVKASWWGDERQERSGRGKRAERKGEKVIFVQNVQSILAPDSHSEEKITWWSKL